ncbi:hypothetical protein D6C99_10298, partial [Aureobasidium pullulans]
MTRNTMLVSEIVENWDSVCIESYTKKFRVVFLFGSVARNAILDAEVVENGSSEYLEFRSAEFRALSLFGHATSNVILDSEVFGRREGGNTGTITFQDCEKYAEASYE